jgi:hypothetical protein
MSITTQFPTNEIFKETAEVLTLDVFVDGVAATIAASPVPTYTVYDSGKNEKASGNLTISTNSLSATIADTVFDTLQENCFIEFNFTIGSQAYYIVEYFHVVKRKMYCMVTDLDIKKYYPDLLPDKLWNSQSTINDQIQLAFRDVQLDIFNRGNRIRLIPNNMAIKKLIELKTLLILFEAFYREDDDVWMNRMERIEEKYRTQFDGTRFEYDADENLIVDQVKNMGVIDLNR